MTANNGGPAFPCTVFTQDGHKSGESMGLSLRDWFAGQALAGMGVGYLAGGTILVSAAKQAYAQADAMLAAREVQS